MEEAQRLKGSDFLLRQAGCSLHRVGSELLPATVFERTRRTTACPIRIHPAELPTMATLSRRSSMSSPFSSPRKTPNDLRRYSSKGAAEVELIPAGMVLVNSNVFDMLGYGSLVKLCVPFSIRTRPISIPSRHWRSPLI
jgi:hypothetical protein